MRCMILGLCLLLSLNVCAEEEDLQPLYMDKHEFAISFPANPTTGYLWSIVHYDQRILVLQKSEYMPPDHTKGIGAAGKMLYEFEFASSVQYPIQTVITFRYARPWDIQHGIVKKATISAKRGQQRPLIQIQ